MSTVEQQAAGVANTVRLVIALGPCIMYLAGALVVWFYNFNRAETRRVQSQLPHGLSSGS